MNQPKIGFSGVVLALAENFATDRLRPGHISDSGRWSRVRS